jgi:hypothetical protein
MPVIGRSASVEIDTMDGFITTNVLRPHGHLVMGCSRAPYLVEGGEAFLKTFSVFDGRYPRPTADIDVAWDGVRFRYLAGRAATQLPSARAEAGLARLASFGAYSHPPAGIGSCGSFARSRCAARALAAIPPTSW